MTDRDFQNVIDRARPDHWTLIVSDFHDRSNSTTFAWPEKGTDVRELLAAAGMYGKYLVQAERIDNGEVTESAMKSAKTRLRKHGPLSTVVEVGPGGDQPGGGTRSSAATVASMAAGGTARTGTFADPALEAMRKETQAIELETQRMQAELRRLRVERDMQHLAGDSGRSDVSMLREELRELRNQRKPDHSALVQAFVPLASAIITSMMESRSRHDELLLQILGGSGKSDEQASSPLEQQLPVLRALMDLGKEFGGDSSPSQIGEVASLIQSIGTLGPATAPVPGAPQVAQQPVPARKAPTPQQAMRLKVLKFLSIVQEWATVQADPATCAEEALPALGLLPKDFRDLVLQNGVDSVIAGLVRFMPPPLYQKLTGALQANAAMKVWLHEFLEELQHEDDEEEVDEQEPLAAAPVSDQGISIEELDEMTASLEQDLQPESRLPDPQPLTQAPPPNLMGDNGQASTG